MRQDHLLFRMHRRAELHQVLREVQKEVKVHHLEEENLDDLSDHDDVHHDEHHHSHHGNL